MYIGIVAAVLLASQLPALTRGFVYSSGMPAVVVAGSGLIGAALALWLILDWRRESSAAPETDVSV